MDWRLHYPGAPDSGVKLLTRILSRYIPKRARKYDLELVVAAILYRVDNGCKWRALDRPGVLPWKNAYDYFRNWARTGVWDEANSLMVRLERRRQNAAHDLDAHSEPAVIVADAQVAKSRVWGVRESLGYDGFKKVKGVARHVAADVRGNVLACVCGPANDHESRWLKDLLIAVRYAGFRRACVVVADGGYVGMDLDSATEGFELEIVKRSDLDGGKAEGKPNMFKPLRRRWVIERTFGYQMFSRIVACCYDRLDECEECNFLLANMRVLLKRWEKL